MPDDLYLRALSEVERAMADEPHQQFCGRFAASADGDRLACNCDYGSRLASRLARMLAAMRRNCALCMGLGFWDSPDKGRIECPNCGQSLQAVARAREAP